MDRSIIIDSHCHIYPDGIARKAVKAVDRFYDGLPSDHYDGTVQTLLRSGRECGICHFIVHSVATTPHQVSSINRFIRESKDEACGCFTGLGTLHPDSPDQEKDLNEIVELGLSGVKLHPDIQKFCVDDPRAMRIFALCQEKKLPVCVHTGDYRYDYSNPARVARVLRTFPRLTLIGAHFGGWSVWEEAAKVLEPFRNLVVDTSSSFFWLKPEAARRLIRIYGSGRVMFGTDYPLWKQQPDLDYLEKLELTDQEYGNILWKNAVRVFRIDGYQSV